MGLHSGLCRLIGSFGPISFEMSYFDLDSPNHHPANVLIARSDSVVEGRIYRFITVVFSRADLCVGLLVCPFYVETR